jgi:ribosomal protein L6P/L9E
LTENQFVERIGKYLNETVEVEVNDQEEFYLEGISREKMWMRKACLSQSHQPQEGSSSKTA